MSRGITKVWKSDVITVAAPKKDLRAGYLTIHLGKDQLIWIDRDKAKELLDAIKAQLALMV